MEINGNLILNLGAICTPIWVHGSDIGPDRGTLKVYPDLGYSWLLDVRVFFAPRNQWLAPFRYTTDDVDSNSVLGSVEKLAESEV